MINCLDHIAVVSNRADALFSSYERLGFVLTPLSMHRGSVKPGEPPVPWGTGNRCAMFRAGYLELLAIIDPTIYCGVFPDLLERYEGLHILAFGCDDARAEEARLARSGMEVLGIITLKRELETPDGTGLARFSLVRLAPELSPEGRLNIIQHHTPELLWQPHQLDHANGAQALVELVACVADPEEAARRYEAVLGTPSRRRGPAYSLDLSDGRFMLVSPDDLGAIIPAPHPNVVPSIVSFTVATDRIDHVGDLLASADVAAEQDGHRLIVPAEFGCGAICIFEPIWMGTAN